MREGIQAPLIDFKDEYPIEKMMRHRQSSIKSESEDPANSDMEINDFSVRTGPEDHATTPSISRKDVAIASLLHRVELDSINAKAVEKERDRVLKENDTLLRSQDPTASNEEATQIYNISMSKDIAELKKDYADLYPGVAEAMRHMKF